MNVGPKVDALNLMLRMDAQIVLTSTGTTAKALSRRCNIPDGLLRGMNERDWSPTHKTLLRIERMISNDTARPSHDLYSWHETKDEVGFIFCRNRKVSERDANTFGPVLDVYVKDVLEEDRLSALEALSTVTVIDVTAEMPTGFFIANTRNWPARLMAPTTLGNAPGNPWKIVSRCGDAGLPEGQIYRRESFQRYLLDQLWEHPGQFLPEADATAWGYVILAVHHHFTKFDGNLGCWEITSDFDA